MIFGTNGGLFACVTLLMRFKFITCQLPNTANCSTINGIEHCFITWGGTSGGLRQWHQARDMCSGIEGGLYSLPVLDNDHIRTAMERYMVQQELYPESVWTAGRVERLPNWTWLDGSPYNGFNPLPMNSGQLSAAKMNIRNGNISFINNTVATQEKLICQFTGSTCDLFRGPPPGFPGFFQSPTDVNSSCYVVFPRHNEYVKSTQKWYTARNICLQQKGDLADYNITLLGTRLLSNFLDNTLDYYIGLRQHRLVWDPSNNNGNSSDIKETYFEGNAPGTPGSATCIAVRYSGQWVWEARDCDAVTQVVCHKGAQTATPNTVSSTSPTTKVPYITYGGMIGVAVGACIFFVLAIVAAVLITYFIIKRNPCGPHEDDIYADNVHNGQHHCNDEEDKEDYVNTGQMQDDNPDGRNPYADGGPSRAW